MLLLLPFSAPHTEPTGHYVLAWKRDIAVLTAGDVKVTMNPRIRLMPVQQLPASLTGQHQHRQSSSSSSQRTALMQIHMPLSSLSSSPSLSAPLLSDTSSVALHSSSYNLEIQSVRPSDAGEYACQIGTLVPKEIVHSLEVLGRTQQNTTSRTEARHARNNT